MNRTSFASRWNLDAIEEAHQQWLQNPEAVDENWRAFFEGFELGNNRSSKPGSDVPTGLFAYVDAFRNWGHMSAHLDPLNAPPGTHKYLEPTNFGFTSADMNKPLNNIPYPGLSKGTLADLTGALKETYCRTMGIEYMHIQDPEIRRWFQEKIEARRSKPNLSQQVKLHLLRKLYYADMFEKFLSVNYQGAKRFGLEGAETMIPVLDTIIEKVGQLGGEEIVFGMPHRGRLNVLVNILRKPYGEIFAEFEDIISANSFHGDGDVKYHLGFSCDYETQAGKNVHLTLTPNPSHLEAVDPVVEGRVRAKQKLRGDTDRRKVIPLLLHGDAAFAGQGLVAETLNLSQLQGYKTGGTLHFVVNNQLGFTTKPSDARSSLYCTDVGKLIDAPVLHVNAEDPEVCVFVAELAVEFRQKFNRDIIIDMYCYRKNGHNETDEPSFTQPVMYSKIKTRPTITTIYSEQLSKQGDLSPGVLAQTEQEFKARADKAKKEVGAGPTKRFMEGFSGRWKDRDVKVDMLAEVKTAPKAADFYDVGRVLNHVPEGFPIHPTLGRIISTRAKSFEEKQPIEWGFAELLAYGTLLKEGFNVRLSGQDCRRGTFSHRHAVWYNNSNNEPYTALNNLEPNQKNTLSVYDSLLSEAAVMGFEYGYSLDDPESLVLWEAQFGDFVNGAQVLLDQFIISGETKWQRASGLVLLLPHGFEGQGPEHSSARLERFLQCAAEDNIQVCMLTTPAQHFHMLRRQLHRKFRKPLVVMTPKSLLRLAPSFSSHEEFLEGSFQEILDDNLAGVEAAKRVVLCSGKVYYDLEKYRTENKVADVAIVRIEQLYPLHEAMLKKVLSRYKKAKEFVWAQEEPHNNGAWSFLQPRLAAMGINAQYAGRDAAASPAVGSHWIHELEQLELVEAALVGTPHPVHIEGQKNKAVAAGGKKPKVAKAS